MILCTGCKTRWNGEWWNLFHGSGLAAGFAEAFAFVVSFAAGGGVAIDVARGFECGNGLEESGFGGWGVGAVVHVGVLAEEEGVEAFEAQALFICRGGEWVSHEGAAGGEAFFECFALQGGGHAHAGQEEVLLGGKVAAFGGFGAVFNRFLMKSTLSDASRIISGPNTSLLPGSTQHAGDLHGLPYNASNGDIPKLA